MCLQGFLQPIFDWGLLVYIMVDKNGGLLLCYPGTNCGLLLLCPSFTMPCKGPAEESTTGTSPLEPLQREGSEEVMRESLYIFTPACKNRVTSRLLSFYSSFLTPKRMTQMLSVAFCNKKSLRL